MGRSKKPEKKSSTLHRDHLYGTRAGAGGRKKMNSYNLDNHFCTLFRTQIEKLDATPQGPHHRALIQTLNHVKITNLVATARFDKIHNIEEFTIMVNGKFTLKLPATIMNVGDFMRNEQTGELEFYSISVEGFRSRKGMFAGASTPYFTLKYATLAALQMTRTSRCRLHLYNLRIQNMAAYAELPFQVDTQKFLELNRVRVIKINKEHGYDPTSRDAHRVYTKLCFPALIVKVGGPIQVTFSIFKQGKIIATGARFRTNIFKAILYIVPLLWECRTIKK